MKLSSLRQHARVTDGAGVNSDLSIVAEFCVIGSGAGGAVAAATLAELGHDVALIEEGAFVIGQDLTLHEADALPLLYQEGSQRATADGAIGILQGRAVGGTTFVNWTTSLRAREEVLELWRDEHAVGDIAYSDLEQHYAAMEKRLAVSKVPPELMNRNNQLLYDGCKTLGWQTDTVSRNVFRCAELGVCGLGCPSNAKRSMAVTFVPDLIEAGGRILSRCRVLQLEFEAGRATRASGLLLAADGLTPTGKRVDITAKTFIVSGGAINSPALLLRSGFDAGQRVGERTFLHPATASLAVYGDVVDAHLGAPQSAVSTEFFNRDEGPGIFLECAPWSPALASTLVRGFGSDHLQMMARFRHTAVHLGISVDGQKGEPGGRVRLLPSGAPSLDYPIEPRHWQTFAFAQARLAEVALATGALEVRTLHDPPFVIREAADIDQIASLPWAPVVAGLFSAHQMGGCRMGDDPGDAVTRSWDLRLHDVENVHVIDGSVFPTGLGINPQLTIFALSRLVATRIHDDLGSHS